MGSSLQRVSNIKVMIRGGENLADKSAGITIKKFSSIFLHQRKSRKNHALSDKQQYSLVLFFKMKRKKNRHLVKLSKEIWQYLLNHNLSIIIAEYLPLAPNTVEDRELRKKRHSSEWLLHPKVFQTFSQQHISLLPAYVINYLSV